MRTGGRDHGRAGAAIAAMAATVLLLAGCAKKRIEPPAPSPDRTSARPAPPVGAYDGLKLPPADGKGGYRTVNSDLADTEAVWHLRSALNVAALSCDRDRGLGIAANYNRMLDKQRASLATAYRAEGQRFGSAQRTDAHITQVYNFFAQPFAQARFCAVAAKVAAEAQALPTSGLAGFAPDALTRLTEPFSDFYDRYARYRVALADWERGDRPPFRAEVRQAAAAPSSKEPPWRIQLGAYSGGPAAREAWGRIRSRMQAAEKFEPRYEAVPGSRLVRVRVGPVTDRGAAIALCAAAAGAGLDCLPVPPKA